ncbi:MAG TPA: hypothetical protein VK982_07085 [Bacteroidales bacterium]|nr:hypothetical protein [Bacteroidales bacterium]
MTCSITGVRCPTKKVNVIGSDGTVDKLHVSKQILFNEGMLELNTITLQEYIDIMEEYNIPIENWEE